MKRSREEVEGRGTWHSCICVGLGTWPKPPVVSLYHVIQPHSILTKQQKIPVCKTFGKAQAIKTFTGEWSTVEEKTEVMCLLFSVSNLRSDCLGPLSSLLSPPLSSTSGFVFFFPYGQQESMVCITDLSQLICKAEMDPHSRAPQCRDWRDQDKVAALPGLSLTTNLSLKKPLELCRVRHIISQFYENPFVIGIHRLKETYQGIFAWFSDFWKKKKKSLQIQCLEQISTAKNNKGTWFKKKKNDGVLYLVLIQHLLL